MDGKPKKPKGNKLGQVKVVIFDFSKRRDRAPAKSGAPVPPLPDWKKLHPTGEGLKFTQSIYNRDTSNLNFGGDSIGICPPIDSVVAGQLARSLTAISEDIFQACFERGLLTRPLDSALRMVEFLALTFPAARHAQHLTGVPASILISDAYQISGPRYPSPFGSEQGFHNDIFEVGHSFVSLADAFIDRAVWLGNHPDFQAAMRAANPEQFLSELKRCKVWEEPMDLADRIDNIIRHELQQCDFLHSF